MSCKSFRTGLPSSTRIPLAGDRESIRVALTAALYRSLAPSGSEFNSSSVSYFCDDPAYTVEMIVQGLVDAVVIDESYLLVYAIVTPWYSKNSRVLHEELVLRLAKGSSFSRVVETLECIARDEECDAIVVGGALARSSRAIVRMYQRYGFVLETGTPSLTKRRR